jgi:hypothetical protein
MVLTDDAAHDFSLRAHRFDQRRKRPTSGNAFSPGPTRRMPNVIVAPGPKSKVCLMQNSSNSSGRKLPARYNAIVMPLLLSIAMTFVVSAISTLKSLGFNASFLANWPSAWAISWIVAFPTLLIILPVVRWLVGLLVEPAGRR